MKNEEITLKNTKAEILEALNEALEREKSVMSTKFDPIKESNEEAIEKAVKSSKSNVEQNIFSSEFTNKFNDLEIAINAEEEKLKNLYGIEKELQNIVLVINAGKESISKIENEKKVKTEEITNELKQLEENFNRKNEELQQEYTDKAKQLKMERDRENEEYTYKLKRDRAIENDKWEDEKSEREENLAKMETEAKKLLEEATNKADYIKELEEKVNSISDLLQKEYTRARQEVTKELNREYEYKTALAEKDYANTADRLNDKIEAITKELEKSNQLNQVLQEKLDNAYMEIKNLATKTVETSGKVKIINTTNEDD